MEWSWVSTLEEVEQRRQVASCLAGLQLAAVRYCQIDYALPDRPDGLDGPRQVVSDSEWQDPTFRYAFGDSTDFGVELETTCGRLFTVSWDSPSWHEGIWLRQVPLVGYAVQFDANCAIWDVSDAGRWDRFIGQEITAVRLHYRPWAPNDGFWCTRITVTISGSDVEFLGGQADAEQDLAPSADNIAVIFPPAQLPAWTVFADEI